MVKTKTNFKLYFDLAFYQAIMLMNYLTLLFRSIEDISRPLSTFLFIALIIAADVIGIKGVVKKQRSKSQDFLLLGNLDSFLCQIAKITILAEFLVQQTQRQKNCVFAVLKMWKIFLIYAAFFIAGFFKWNL